MPVLNTSDQPTSDSFEHFYRLVGKGIPLEGRITAVTDVFDALSTERLYKPAFPLKKCFAILSSGSGTHFDRRLVEAFLKQRDKVVNVYATCQ